MKNLKKVLAVVMAIALVVTCFAACGGNKDNKNDANEIVIGVSGPLTGSAAQYGNAVVNAAKLAVDEINAAGGINGVMIEYTFEDDENNAELAKTETITLVLAEQETKK